MVTRKIDIAPVLIADGKRLYEMTSTPVPDIAAMMGISRRTLERRILEWGWAQRHAPRFVTDRALVADPPPATPVASHAGAVDAAATESDLRAANAARIQRLVAGSLDAIDRVLAKVGPADESGSERSARTLAAVARTLHEMSDMTHLNDETPADANAADNERWYRDMDEFRFELARRIRGIVAARRAELSERADGAAANPEAR